MPVIAHMDQGLDSACRMDPRTTIVSFCEFGGLVISHDLRDVQEVADRVVVLRLGEKVAEFAAGNYSSQDLVGAITGAHEASSGGAA